MLKEKVPLLESKITNLESINSNWETIDSLRLEQVEMYKQAVADREKAIKKLKRRSKLKACLTGILASSTVALGILCAVK